MVVFTTRPCNVDISFKDITHCVTTSGKQKVILSHVSGEFEHGKLHAIMGPSGAGKSSLLNVLAGLNYVANGTVTINNRQSYTVSKWSNVICPIRSYILQDDYLVPELTVRETLIFAAALNRPKESARRQAKVVDALLQQMGLTELSGRAISALSGGQKKRVSVSTELVNYKPVLFLDEPTTGLDSASTYRLIDLLKSVAKAGCNVIATIHQPSSRVFTIFDSLTVLATGGRPAYSGPPSALAGSIERLTGRFVPHLDNPADFLFDGDTISKMADVTPSHRRKMIETAMVDFENSQNSQRLKVHLANLEGDSGDNNCFLKKKKKSTHSTNSSSTCKSTDELLDVCEKSGPSTGERFATLFKRSVIHTWRDKVFLLGRFIAYVLSTILVGITFQFVGNDATKVYSNVAFLFILSKIFMLGSSIVTIMSSPIHLNILLRENINSWYAFSVFFWTRTFIETVINILLSTVFPIAMWMMSGQQQAPGFALPYLVLILCLHAIATHHFSFIIAMFSDFQSLPQLPFAVAMLNVTFGGYFVPLRDLPVWIFWMRYVNFGSFTFEGLMKIAYAPVSSEKPAVELPCKLSDPTFNPICARFRNGRDVLESWGIDDLAEPLWKDIMALALYLIVLALIHWGLLALYLIRARRSVARI